MTSSELAKEVFSILEAKLFERPSPIEFEMAYQARIAIEKIRFAIRANETAAADSVQGQEAGLQLLDALDRLESMDRRFQERSRRCSPTPLSSGIVELRKAVTT